MINQIGVGLSWAQMERVSIKSKRYDEFNGCSRKLWKRYKTGKLTYQLHANGVDVATGGLVSKCTVYIY